MDALEREYDRLDYGSDGRHPWPERPEEGWRQQSKVLYGEPDDRLYDDVRPDNRDA